MLPKFRASLILFSIGTIISVSIGIFSAYQSNNIYDSIILSINSEIVVLLISLFATIFEIRAQTSDWLGGMVALIKSGNYISSTQDEIYAERYQRIMQEIEELANGKYQLEKLSDVYDDDIRSIRQLQKGESLQSMCPVPGNEDAVINQFTNKNFGASIEAHFRAAQRGVTVHRIYIYEQSASFYSEISQNHLKLNKRNKINAYIILLDDERFLDAHELPRDFIIFGSRKVSVGRVGTDSRVSGGDVYADRQSIELYRREYERLLRVSDSLSEFEIKKKN